MLYRFDEYELDRDRYELRRRGQLVALEPQVFDLLLYLVEHHSRLVAKDELMEFIWKDREVSESTLGARISAARRAVGDSGREQRLIHTVARRGFRFVAHVEELAAPGLPGNGESDPGMRWGNGSMPTAVIEAEEMQTETGLNGFSSSSASTASLDYLCGSFACYSYAWSPTYAGRIIRASLTISKIDDASSELRARYMENLSFAQLDHVSEVSVLDRILYMDFVDRKRGSWLFANFHFPGAPASALLGVLSGKTYHHPSMEVVATRILAVRVPPLASERLADSNRYLTPEYSITADLNALGLPLGDDREHEIAFLAALKGQPESNLTRVTSDENRRVNVALDMALSSRSSRQSQDPRPLMESPRELEP